MQDKRTDKEIYLHLEYITEKRNKKIFNIVSLLMIFGSAILFLVILFREGYTADTKLVALMYWGYFTSFSSILLIPYYQIPQLVLNLGLGNDEVRDLSWNLICRNPQFYIRPLFHSQGIDLPQGMEFSQDGFKVEREWILNKFHLTDRSDWKLIGRRYFVFYLIASPIILFIFLKGIIG